MKNEKFEKYLNIETAKFPENSTRGFMVCGMNWGGEPADYPNELYIEQEPTFFSDSVITYPYKDRLVEWFSLLDHPLERSRGREGKFERSIVQTNWLTSKSTSIKTNKFRAECIREWDQFESRVAQLNPMVIMFLSVVMLDVMNLRRFESRTSKLLGPVEDRKFWPRNGEVLSGTKGLKRYRVRVQKHQNATIIALPHPTPTRPKPRPPDEFIKAYKRYLSPIIAGYKAKRGFPP